MLEAEARAGAVEELVLPSDEVGVVGASADPKVDRLHAEDDEQAAENQRVRLEVASEDRNVPEDEQNGRGGRPSSSAKPGKVKRKFGW